MRISCAAEIQRPKVVDRIRRCCACRDTSRRQSPDSIPKKAIAGLDRRARYLQNRLPELQVVRRNQMNAQTRIYLLRHGETEWNRERRIQGHGDSPLTVRGRRQAVANAERLAGLIGDHSGVRFISSPLGRCRETTALICNVLGVDPSRVEFDDRLKEYGYGVWEGKTEAEIRSEDPDRFAARQADKWDVAAPDGESYSMVAERLRAWLADVEGHTVVAISHGSAGQILRCIYAGLPRARVSALSKAHEEIHILAANSTITVERTDASRKRT